MSKGAPRAQRSVVLCHAEGASILRAKPPSVLATGAEGVGEYWPWSELTATVLYL